MTHVRPGIWPSRRGIWLLLLLCGLLALASVVAWVGVLLVAASGATLALVLADLRLGPRPRDLELKRQPVAYAVVGRPARLTYALDNRSRSSVLAKTWEAPIGSIAFDEDVASVPVSGASRLEFVRDFVGLDRGLARFDAMYARVTNRIGLVERRLVVHEPLDLRVYPDFSVVEGYGTLARRSTLLEIGLRKLRLRGAGNEFESLREYEAGDAFRAINWKATARRGRLMVEQYDVERSQTVLIAVDAGRLMTPRIGPRRKFDYALTAALSAVRVAQIAGDKVGFVAFAARTLLHVAPQRGVAHNAALVRRAYDLQPRLEEPDYEAFAADVRHRYAKRSLVIVFTDLFDPAAGAAVLGSLAILSPRHLVVCVLMNDAAIAGALANEPKNARDAYRAAAALTLEDERREAIALLRARGILVVDAAAQRLTIALLDAYLDVKARALL